MEAAIRREEDRQIIASQNAEYEVWVVEIGIFDLNALPFCLIAFYFEGAVISLDLSGPKKIPSNLNRKACGKMSFEGLKRLKRHALNVGSVDG